MAFSKVILNGTTLMDVTGTTAVEGDVNYAKVFTKANGIQTTGTRSQWDKNADFCFWDYDGTLVYSCSFAEMAQMSALPTPPDHSQDDIPLTFQYWNWDLADLKDLTYPMDVGAVYYPTDGKMHWFYELNEVSGLTCSFSIGFGSGGAWSTKKITINWGDGTTPEEWGTDTTNGNNVTHTYAQPGTYHCTWTGKAVPTSAMRKEGNGSIVGTFYVAADQNQDWVNSWWNGTLGESYIDYIVGFTRPPALNCFKNLYNLKAFVSGKPWSTWGEVFSHCPNLKVVCIAKPTSSVGVGDYFCSYSGVPRIRLPKNLTNNQRFSFAYFCNNIEFYNYWANMRACRDSDSLRRVVIIGDIASEAFQNCHIQEIWCGLDSPPTLASTNCFNKISVNCKIHVKASALSDFQTATNWATFADYMIGDWTHDPDR